MRHGLEVPTPFIGDRFPELIVQTTIGEISLPNDYRGRWFVLFSHPGDFTPVCTTEFIAFERMKREFDGLNTQLIGLSVDQVYAHMKWIEWIRKRIGVQITFPIVADSLGTAAKTLGLIGPNLGVRTVRSVYIVDPDGTIRLILTYPETIGRNIHEIKRALEALQVSDAHHVVTPANWPNNEILGDKVMVPPPRTVQDAAKRTSEAMNGDFDCYDWWFCTPR